MELKDIELGISPIKVGDPKYDYRKMLKYCEENKKTTEELTEEELKQFITGYITNNDFKRR